MEEVERVEEEEEEDVERVEEEEEEKEASHLEASPHIHIKRQCQILLRAEIASGRKCFGSLGKSSCGVFFRRVEVQGKPSEGSRGLIMRIICAQMRRFSVFFVASASMDGKGKNSMGYFC